MLVKNSWATRPTPRPLESTTPRPPVYTTENPTPTQPLSSNQAIWFLIEHPQSHQRVGALKNPPYSISNFVAGSFDSKQNRVGNFQEILLIRMRPKKVLDLYLGKLWVTLGRVLGQLFPKYYLTYCPKNKHLYNPYPPKGTQLFPLTVPNQIRKAIWVFPK